MTRDQEYLAYLAEVEADNNAEAEAAAARDAEADMLAAGVFDESNDDYETIMGEWECDDFDREEYLSEVSCGFED